MRVKSRRVGPSFSQIDFEPLLARLGLGDFQGELALTVSFTGHPGDLVMALGSVDETGD